ncbi:carbohydrate binding family 9 domain-containing protein [candidate division WOR-3 bacterium]|nr:carbohydrate binding family 9 domain-containing protein [candidate division WOR-3 bacterium]
MFALVLCLFMAGEKSIELRYTDVAPQIDGIIEDVWRQADLAHYFMQYRPKDGVPACEPTVAYFLADDDNLYVAFRCYTPGRKPVASFKGFEDHVWLYLDTFGSKTMAYMFAICLSGHHDDGLLLEDGRIQDMSWDYVWFFATKMYEDRYDIEVRIPFKSIRYDKDLDTWGLQIRRWHIKDYEVSHWTEVLQKDGMQVSKFGTLRNIRPRTKGYYVELYPEGFFRYDRRGDSTDYTTSPSFNFKWDPTSQMTLNTTVNPDFAQIESDAYSFNLSRYPVRLEERRPFFVEGLDVFRMSHLGLDFFNSLDIFYSRRVGEPLPLPWVGAVPVLGGFKMINKGGDWNIGALGAYTGEINDTITSDTLNIPNRGFGVARISRSILNNSDIGMIFSGTGTDRDDYNLALGLDGAYRAGSSQFILQSAVSDKNDQRGYAVASGGIYRSSNFIAVGSLISVDESFDVTDMGYVPWQGVTNLYVAAGPAWYPETGPILRCYLEPGFILTKYPEGGQWSKLATVFIEPRFRNQLGFYLYAQAGPMHEAETDYVFRGIEGSFWTSARTHMNLNFGGNYSYRYNYYRSRLYDHVWIANQLSTWHWMSFSPVSRISLITYGELIMEWHPDGELHAITPVWTPRIEYQIMATMGLSTYSEFVFATEEGRLSTAEIYSNRIGFLFSWNFLPKSWIYVAFNNLRRDSGNGLELAERIAAIKLKYLIYF